MMGVPAEVAVRSPTSAGSAIPNTGCRPSGRTSFWRAWTRGRSTKRTGTVGRGPAWRRYVQIMIRYGLMFAALLFAAACASEPAPTLPPPAPTTSILSAAVPRTTGIAVTPEQLAKADPCGLANEDSLAKFGKVSLDIGIAFTECELTLVIGRHDVVTEQSTIFVAARRSPLPGPDLHDRHRRSESVLVTFTRANRPEADEQPDRKITIDGHEAVIDLWTARWASSRSSSCRSASTAKHQRTPAANPRRTWRPRLSGKQAAT